MGSLLAKMKRLRASVADTPQNEENNSAEQGMSEEELEVITRKIDEVAYANRIQATPELFKIHAQKRGVFLPAMVNLLAILVLAGGIGFSFFAYQQQETDFVQQVRTLESAEGRLLEVLRQEAEENLAAKEEEIRNIQEQMSQVRMERDEFEESMEDRIARREAALRSELEQELEAERERLRRQGLSEADIEARIREIERQKNEEMNQALNEFRARAEAEREALNASLTQLESQYSQNLAAADAERAELARQAQQRAAELEQVSREVQSAQRELADIAARREAEARLMSQLTGFYRQLNNQLESGEFNRARQTIENLRAFLNSPRFNDVESMRQRREVDLFLADALEQLIEKEDETTDQNVNLARAASAISRIQSLHAEAQEYAQAGQQQQALESYTDALAVLPEIQQASRALAQQTGSRSEAEYSRMLEEMEERLNEELEAQREQLASEFDQEREDWDEQEADLQKQLAEQDELRAALQEQLNGVQRQLETVQSQLDDQQSRGVEQFAEYEQAQTRITELQQENERLQNALENAENNAGRSRSEMRDRLAELETLAAELQVTVNQYQDMTNAYQSYRNEQEAAFERGGSAAIVQGKAALDAFLASSAVQTAFPGILDQVRVYDQAFEESGQQNILYEVADQVYTIYSYPGKQARLEYISDAIENEDREAMLEFYENMRALVSE